MTSNAKTAPILAVDIDGVLNAFGTGPPEPGWGDILVCRSHDGEPPRLFRLRFAPAIGARLAALAAQGGAELTWCTRWESMANTLMAPLLSLPPLPVVPMAPSKWEALSAYAGRRPVCWLDDEPEPATSHRAPALIIAVNPVTGITAADLEQARTWLTELAA